MDATVEVEDDPYSASKHDAVDGLPYNASLIQFGWVIVLVLGIAYYVLKNYTTRSTSTSPASSYSTEDEVRRRAAMEASRLRLQERFNQEVDQFKTKQLERDALRAQAKADKWNALTTGKSSIREVPGPSNDSEAGDGQKPTRNKRDKPKTPFRPDDYNPLMGTSFCRYRPTGRGSGGSGG